VVKHEGNGWTEGKGKDSLRAERDWELALPFCLEADARWQHWMVLL